MQQPKRLVARFYRSATGEEPVRSWLRGLSREDRLAIGTDVKTVEFGWPVGMPTCRPMGAGMYEVRTRLKNRTARILFCLRTGELVLLHGFIKKTQKTPVSDLDLAKRRQKELENR